MEIGLIAVRQITNELLWYEAMKEIHKTFKKEKYFKDLSGATKFDLKYMKMLELSESLNFASSGCVKLLRKWRSFSYFLTPELKKDIWAGNLKLKDGLSTTLEEAKKQNAELIYNIEWNEKEKYWSPSDRVLCFRNQEIITLNYFYVNEMRMINLVL